MGKAERALTTAEVKAMLPRIIEKGNFLAVKNLTEFQQKMAIDAFIREIEKLIQLKQGINKHEVATTLHQLDWYNKISEIALDLRILITESVRQEAHDEFMKSRDAARENLANHWEFLVKARKALQEVKVQEEIIGYRRVRKDQ